MRLLSRNAESLFWLARYLERSASLARVIEMQSSFGSHDPQVGWTWLLSLHGDEARFRERYQVSSNNIIAFYVSDLANGGSIRSSIHWARENARALRPYIPLEMWVQLNTFYGAVEHLGPSAIEPTELPRTCAEIRAGCLAQIGIAEGTLYRDEGYEFFKLGLMIERADQTSRLLDVKFAQGARTAASGDASEGFVFWSTILRTAAAYQVFHRLEAAQAEPERVARFLIQNPCHPRSIGYCVHAIDASLQMLRSSFHLTRTNAALEACEVLMAGLQAAAGDAALLQRLHDFNDWVQRSLISLTDGISSAFFLAPTVTPEMTGQRRKVKRSRSQRQEQKQS